ncbi:MAG: PilW family protein [Gammaproteobacteria bacterium]|nr:PilW family protein [Gammaproteobacteria bacterium]
MKTFTIKFTSACSPKRGYTLLEFVIVLALGSFILLSLTKLLTKGHRIFVNQEERAIREEKIRAAFSVLREELQNVGYLGCASRENAKHLVNHLKPSLGFDPKHLLKVVQGESGASDTLEVRRALEASSTDVIVPVEQRDPHFWVDNVNPGFLQIDRFDVVGISNCEQAEIFLAQKEGFAHNVIYYAQIPAPDEDFVPKNYRGLQNKSTHLSNAWDRGMVPKIFKMHTAHYSIDGRSLLQNGQELISGVTNFQIQLGVNEKCDGSVGLYVEPPLSKFLEAFDFSKVVAIRLQLTFQGKDSAPVTVTDTVQLRNSKCGPLSIDTG